MCEWPDRVLLTDQEVLRAGERWLDVTTEHTDPGFVLWSWAKYYPEPETLPELRVLVEFTFPDELPTNRRTWLLAERRSADLCYSHPGGEADVFITARSEAFTLWHLGIIDWRRALADGSITVSGTSTPARAVPTRCFVRDCPILCVSGRDGGGQLAAWIRSP